MSWPLVLRSTMWNALNTQNKLTQLWRDQASSNLKEIIGVRLELKVMREERDHWKAECMQAQLELNQAEDARDE